MIKGYLNRKTSNVFWENNMKNSQKIFDFMELHKDDPEKIEKFLIINGILLMKN